MKVAFICDQWNKIYTAQVRIMLKLVRQSAEKHEIASWDEWEKAEVIVSNGYKMSVLVMFFNLFWRKKHIIIISETPERIPFWWRLLRHKKVFVTSEYIKNKLGFGEVVRIGYV